jgi:hypothetical protein
MSFPKSTWQTGDVWDAPQVNDLEARVAAAIEASAGIVPGCNGDGVTNNLTAVRAGIAASANSTIAFPAGTFVVSNAAALGAALTFGGTSLTVVGAGRDATIIKLGPDGANAAGFGLFGIGDGQTLTLENLTLQGPTLGGSGPAADPGAPAGSSYSQSTIDTSTTPGALVRYRNVHVKGFAFCGMHTGSMEATDSWFEGRGDAGRSMGPDGGDGNASVYSTARYFKFRNTRLSSFGDPTGGAFYHFLYVGTSHSLDLVGCLLDSPASTSTGPMVQHWDTSVAPTRASPHAVFEGCYFASGTMYTVETSYNCTTKLIGCTLDDIEVYGILAAGPTIVDACTLSIGADGANAIVTAAQGQDTGLDWGLDFTGGSRINLNGYIATGIDLANSNATSEFNIGGGAVFEGAAAGDGIYVYMEGINGRVNLGEATFTGHPNYAVRGQGTGGVLSMTAGTRFLLAGGIDVLTATPVLATLRAVDVEFGGVGTPFDLHYGVPTVVHCERNYGSQWVVRTAVSSTPYTMLRYDELLAVTNTTSAVTINAVAANSVHDGKEIVIADESGGAAAHNITFVPAGADTLKGSGVIGTNSGFQRWRSNGSNGWTRVG